MSEHKNKRILIVSHGHPDINKGGAEVAAYNMYKELRNRGEDAFFLARTGLVPHGGAAFSSRNDDREILFHTTMDDGFLFSNIKTRHMWQEFRDLLLLLKPQVVHLHHYFLLGIEMLQEIRSHLPDCKIVVTLHEYLAICHQNGLMVKTNGKLCYKAGPRDCSGCFPEKNPGDFFLREKYIKSMFDLVDQFISPSHFLKQRYVDWGVASTQIEVIENGQPEFIQQEVNRPVENSMVRFAFFGQINPYKGLDVLIEAVTMLPRSVKKLINVAIHGANLDMQSDDFVSKIKLMLKKTENIVDFCGSYESHEIPGLMADVDWVVVPSVWWENSPMVIQESFSSSNPIICSDLGGMAEKVENHVTGLHFRAGRALSLAQTIQSVVIDRTIKEEMIKNIKKPLSISECVDKHFVLYTL